MIESKRYDNRRWRGNGEEMERRIAQLSSQDLAPKLNCQGRGWKTGVLSQMSRWGMVVELGCREGTNQSQKVGRVAKAAGMQPHVGIERPLIKPMLQLLQPFRESNAGFSM